MLKDLKNNLDVAQSLAPAARTADANGTSVDLQNAVAALAVCSIGAWTDGAFTPILQESDDDSAWSDVAAADLEGAFVAVTDGATDDTTQKVGYKGTLRYIRMKVDQTASPAPSTGVLIGADILTEPKGKPSA